MPLLGVGGCDCPSEYIFPQYIGKANGKGLTSDQPMRHFQCLNWEISGRQMFFILIHLEKQTN